jgi:hypothetical protein
MWLEGRYGWRIFVYEMLDLHKALSSFDDSRERYRNSVGYSEATSSVEHESYSASSGTYKFDINYITDLSVRGTVVLDIKPPKFRFNPIVTGWEVIPYSFVIDWLIGIGNWFETLSALALSTQSVAAGGIKYTVTKSWNMVDYIPASGWSGLQQCSGYVTYEYTRRVPTSIPKLPQIGSGLDALKVGDLIALLLAAIRK